MEKERIMGIIESILFAAGREVTIKELMTVLEAESIDIISIVNEMKENYEKEDRGIQIINVDGAYQLCTKKKNYDYICQIFDKRAKLQLSQSAMETLSIIAYNPRITRAEIEAIRGVSSDGVIYKLLDYNLIAETGKLDAPGRPTTFSTTNEFLKMFGLSSLKDLPELPRYKLDSNKQIVIDDIVNGELPDDTAELEIPSKNEEIETSKKS
ncbi:MAG: SMC-Scp complex subunit ScpB [Clostridia bacterium]|mgnify:FL=1|jgi:segregation and condensation protein B|nr:SMC-Scp complex subunit ScpB [Clostridia bacterium]